MGICNVCGILLILTRTFSMVKICEVKLTINMRDVPYVILWYVCDLIRTQCHLWSHDTWSLYCALQCIVCDKVVGSVDLISLKPCKWFFLVFQIFTRWGWGRILLETTKPKLIVTSWKLSLRDTSWALGKEFAMRHGAKQCVVDPRTRCSTPSSVQLTLPLGERCWK